MRIPDNRHCTVLSISTASQQIYSNSTASAVEKENDAMRTDYKNNNNSTHFGTEVPVFYSKSDLT
jgi:hypothetical protein